MAHHAAPDDQHQRCVPGRFTWRPRAVEVMAAVAVEPRALSQWRMHLPWSCCVDSMSRSCVGPIARSIGCLDATHERYDM